jgi:hypothetical protein
LKKCIRSAGGGTSDQLDDIYITKLGVVKHILVDWLKNSIPLYLVVWQNLKELNVS